MLHRYLTPTLRNLPKAGLIGLSSINVGKKSQSIQLIRRCPSCFHHRSVLFTDMPMLWMVSKAVFSNAHDVLSTTEYKNKAEHALTRLSEYFDTLPELVGCDESYDVDYANGVLNVKVSPKVGTYVINMQTPNRQIWLSSPVSGPKRYDYINGKWTYSRDGITLDDLLTQEFRKIYSCDDIIFEID